MSAARAIAAILAIAACACSRDRADEHAPPASSATRTTGAQVVAAPRPAPTVTPTAPPPPSAPSARAITTRATLPCDVPTIRFAPGSARLTPAQQAALAHVAGCLTRGPWSSRHVTLIGLANPTGSRDANLALGDARAESVADILEAHGVPPDRISVGSAGVSLDEPGVAHADERRVAIWLGP